MTQTLRRLLAAAGLVTITAAGAPAAAAPAIGPLRIVLLVDSSSAVSPHLTSFRAGLAAFLDALPGDPEIAFITTGGQMRIRVPPTIDRATLRHAAAGFASDGGANALLETLLESDQRFLKKAPGRRPIFVVVTTDNNSSRGDERIDAYNLFMRDFVQRSGRAHAIVVHGVNAGTTTDILMNLTGNTGGFYDALAVPNALPERMRALAAMVAADMPE